MSAARWAGTTAVMCGFAWALRLLGPGLREISAGLTDAQGLVDRAGADALVLAVGTALGWLVWAWGALGLLLTALSTVPGACGRLAGLLVAGLLPRAARQVAALALGVGLSTVAPVALPIGAPLAVATATDTGVAPALVDLAAPDWPGAPTTSTPVPDWPQATAEDRVVLRGDCLWDIAADHLQRQHPEAPIGAADVQRAVHAWWLANADVIGPDPDLLLPGQVLRPPPG